MRNLTILLAAVVLSAPGSAQAPAQPADVAVATIEDDGRGTPYVVSRKNSICGIDEPRAITNPAKVDYEDLLTATSEVRLIKKRRIDPESARGIKLMTEARRKVLAACETVRSDDGYCSIWKKIERRDKTPIDDITAKVKAEIGDDNEV